MGYIHVMMHPVYRTNGLYLIPKPNSNPNPPVSPIVLCIITYVETLIDAPTSYSVGYSRKWWLSSIVDVPTAEAKTYEWLEVFFVKHTYMEGGKIDIGRKNTEGVERLLQRSGRPSVYWA